MSGLYFCPHCNITCNSLTTFQSHFSSKAHQNKTRDNVPRQPTMFAVPSSNWKESGITRRGVFFYCRSCDVPLNSEDQVHSHLAGAKHRKASFQNPLNKNLKSATDDVLDDENLNLLDAFSCIDMSKTKALEDFKVFEVDQPFVL